jgi:hypothetical protein
MKTATIALTMVTALVAHGGAAARDTLTQCTRLEFCYCVNADLNAVIETRVGEIRALIKAQRDQGKAIGYLSIPISTAEGSYQHLNFDIAANTKGHVEDRFGTGAAWLLNTANPFGKEKKDASPLPDNASGRDYMLMWTRILEGANGLGPDFDFVYFAGPSDFARELGFTGVNDMAKVDAYYDANNPKDYSDKPIDKRLFRNYYGLRASVSFSYGSHDEWNIIRAINEKRRAADARGIVKQLAVWFDSRAVAPGLYEMPTAAGYAGVCPVN